MVTRTLLFLPLLGISMVTSLELEPLSDAQIFYINNIQSSWKAGRNFKPGDLERVRRLLGVDMEANKRYNELHPLPVSDAQIRDDLPEQFDARVKWPQCKSIGEIRDQSNCGSCWAFGPVEAMTDRMCIHTQTPVQLSAEDILSCCKDCGFGCKGGFPRLSWAYFKEKGIVSGGNYNSSEGCMPYQLPNCDHHVKGKYKPCDKEYTAPECKRKCPKRYHKKYKHDKHFGHKAKIFTSEQQIMQELVDNGPVAADFLVYEDFLTYKSGIYKHTTGEKMGGHAIKIIGYGVEKGQKYWLAANSWNEDWGEKGFFRIAKGTDECNIEDDVIAAIPIQ